MRRDTLIQLCSTGVMLVCLAASGVLAVQITGSAARHKLVYSIKAEEGDPPQVSLGIAMGAFRGIFVNYLWIRANELKEQGRYYEAIDLASTITKLQPRFPRVWAFHAWNMSYNISVSTQTLPERWSWVQAGVKLLRDEGIPANPNEMLLHKELAWIYLHKVAGWTDDANQYYKAQNAGEWTIVLGPPPKQTPESRRDRDAAIELYATWLQKIADAPSTLVEAIGLEPKVRLLVDRLRSEVDLGLDFEMLRRYERQVVVNERSGELLARPVNYSDRGAALRDLVNDPSLADAWGVLLAHTRKRLLIDVYHMEPERMIRYTRKYGPIDWRWPSAHSLYWSARGVERGIIRKYEGNARDFDFLNTDRIVMQSVQDLYRYSDIYFDFYTWVMQPTNARPTLMMMPNIHFIPSYKMILYEVEERGGIFENTRERPFTVMGMGYENFMKDAIRHYYRAGYVKKAEDAKDELFQWEGKNRNDFSQIDEYAKPINEFIANELKDRVGSPNVALSEITGALQAAYNFGLLAGDDDRFRSEFEYAKSFHLAYMNKQYRDVVAQGGGEFRMGMVSRNFRLFAARVFGVYLQAISPEEAKLVYARAPEDLKRWAYDQLVAMYKEVLDSNPSTPSFDSEFPEPAGMEAFRQERQRILEEEQQGAQGLDAR